MKPVVISKYEYVDKVYACWLSKCIGGAFGRPYNGLTKPLSMDGFIAPSDGDIINNGLDFQMVWLKLLQDRGVNPRLCDFADYWLKYLSAYPWEEYGYCNLNLERGLRPPVSGCFDNEFVDHIGGAIRSEIWACIAPGNPQLAAEMAWKDAVLDHAGGEGVYAEMFLAALESAAFVENNPETLVSIGLQMIPSWSAVARVARLAVWARHQGLNRRDARKLILARFKHPHPRHAPQNIGFIVLGWLWGEDYAGALTTGVNCGYATEANGAAIAAISGIVRGTTAIPREWSDAIGDALVAYPFTKELSTPKTLGDLTDQTLAVAKSVLAHRSNTVEFGEATRVVGNRVAGLARNDRARKILEKDYETCVKPASKDVEITLHYFGRPVLTSKEAKLVGVSVEQDGMPISAKIELVAPRGWRISLEGSRGVQALFCITADDVEPVNVVRVRFQTAGQAGQASYVFMGSTQEPKWSPAEEVPTCKECHARIESCICRSE